MGKVAFPLKGTALLTKDDVRAFKWSVIRWIAGVYVLQAVIICGVILWFLPIF